MRVALVHDWLTGMRGGEKVLRELCSLFPESQVYTLFWEPKSVAPEIEGRIVQTSFLQHVRAFADYRNLLPFFPAAIRSLRIREADLVVSSSHAVAKGVRIPVGVPHLCYIHTPMRYLWDDTGNYFAFGRGRRWKHLALRAVTPYLKAFDRRSTVSPTKIVANSQTVRARVRRAYGRDAEVVFPPVDVVFFSPNPAERLDDFYLTVSALEPYKRIDVALEAFRRLNRRLIVIGDGTQRAELQSVAPANVEFIRRVSDEDLRGFYRRCRALIMPGIEDFGMTPVEAQACGRPVICYGEGGGVETVADGRTGLHFWPQAASGLAAAVIHFESRSWDVTVIRRNTERFSADVFRRRIREIASELGANRE